MSRLLLSLFFITLVKSDHFNKTCDGFQATLDLKEVMGSWHVVAIIPEKLFPDRDINCYRVEFSETDEGGLRWLINKTKQTAKSEYNKDTQSTILRPKDKETNSNITKKRTRRETLSLEQKNARREFMSQKIQETIDNIQRNKRRTPIESNTQGMIVKTKHIQKIKDGKEESKQKKRVTRETESGTIVRLRYHTEDAFDVWSKLVFGVNGCFMQVLSLDVGVNDTHKARNHDAMMQLHIIQTEDGPYLLQMLWGRLISAVIYRREPGVTQDQLKPVFQFMEKLRGPQRLPKICGNPMRDLLFYN